jgi:hypothetical protein
MKRVDALLCEFRALINSTEPNSVDLINALKGMIEDLVYEERLRAVNILSLKGIELERETILHILGDSNG